MKHPIPTRWRGTIRSVSALFPLPLVGRGRGGGRSACYRPFAVDSSQSLKVSSASVRRAMPEAGSMIE